MAEVSERLLAVAVRLARKEHERPALAEPVECLGRALGGGCVEHVGRDDGERAAAGVKRQRRAKRPPPGLAVDLDRETARLRTEGDAAARALRRRERPGAGSAGALLAEGLRAGHRDLAAGPRRRRAAPARGLLRPDRLVHERHVERLAEDGLVEVDLAGLADVRSADLRH